MRDMQSCVAVVYNEQNLATSYMTVVHIMHIVIVRRQD